MNVFEKWKKERDDALAAMQQIVEKDERTDADTKAFNDLEGQVKTRSAQMADYTRFTEYRTGADALERRGEVQDTDAFGQPKAGGAPKSFGEQFIESEQFRGYHFRGNSSVFDMEMETRALITTGTPDWDKALYKPQTVTFASPTDSFPLFDVCSVETVSTGNVEWVQYGYGANADSDLGNAGNAAAVVAEGAQKPESTLGARVAGATLDTTAHFVNVSRQSLEDSARLRSIVDGLLLRGVLYKEHLALASSIAGATLPTASDPDLLAAIRIGMGTVQAAGWFPNAVLLNPADWAALDIGVMGSTLNGPQTRQSFWGLTPVAANTQPVGTATVGDFKAGVSHFRRSSIGVYVSDSHAGNFTLNIFTILAERRTYSVVSNPSALCEATSGATE